MLTIVDVRDVSKAHIRALERDNAHGRYICAPTDKLMHMREIVALLDSLGFPTKQVRPLRFVLRPVCARRTRSRLSGHDSILTATASLVSSLVFFLRFLLCCVRLYR